MPDPTRYSKTSGESTKPAAEPLVLLGVHLLAAIPFATVLLFQASLEPMQACSAMLVAFILYFKLVTWFDLKTEVGKLDGFRSLLYAFCWVGMEAKAFFFSPVEKKVTAKEWFEVAFKMTFGFLLVEQAGNIPFITDPFAQAWVVLIGLCFWIYFGIFHLMSCLYRSFGIDAPHLMRSPFRSTSLGEIWSHRWNTSYSLLFHQYLYKPLRSKFSPNFSTLGAFMLSGIAHEAFVSWPVGAGYGLPTLYFMIQGLGVIAERNTFLTKVFEKFPLLNIIYTYSVALLPIGLLFHAPFLEGALYPIVK